MNAPRSDVYRALLDPGAIAQWRVPAGMSSQVNEFDAREGGSFCVSLTYGAPTGTGKSARQTDTYHATSPRSCRTSRSSRCFEFETQAPGSAAR